MTILFAAILAISVPPNASVLDTLLTDSAAKSPAAVSLIPRLEKVASSAKAEGYTPRQGYVGIAAWKAVGEMLTLAIRDLDPTVGESSAAPLHALLLGASSMLRRPDLYEIQAGLTFLDMGIQPLERLRWSSADRYKAAVAELVPTSNNKTREALVRWLSRHSGQVVFETLLQAASQDKTVGIRVLAAQGLARCTDNFCPISRTDLQKRMEAETDDRVRSYWIALAGRLRMEEVVAWCQAQLGTGPLDTGCRTGLTRLGDERAFNMLYDWLVGFEKSTTSLKAGSGFGSALATLGSFARKSFVKGRVLKLVDRALSRNARSPSELVSVAGILGYTADKKRAIRVAEKHRRRFAKRATGDAEAKRVAEALQSSVVMLKR